MVQFRSWMDALGWPEPVTILTSVRDISDSDTYNFDNYKVLYIPSAYINNGGVLVSGIDDWQNNALANRQADVVRYINQKGGSLIALGQSRLWRAYQWLPAALTYTYRDNVYMGVQSDIDTISPNSTADNISHNAWHGYFTGPNGWSGIGRVLAFVRGQCPYPSGPNQRCQATVLCNVNAYLSKELCYNGEGRVGFAAFSLRRRVDNHLLQKLSMSTWHRPRGCG